MIKAKEYGREHYSDLPREYAANAFLMPPAEDQLLKQRGYQYIKNYSEANGYPPSVRDIARGVGIKSTSTVHNDLRELEKNGLLRIDGKKSRSIVLVEPEPDAAELRKIASRLGAYCRAQDSCDGCLFSEQDMFGESGCTLAGVIFGRGAEVYVPWETAKNKRSKRRK